MTASGIISIWFLTLCMILKDFYRQYGTEKFFTLYKDVSGSYSRFYVTKLCLNYRSHPQILDVASRLFYDAELISGLKPKERVAKFGTMLPNPEIPIVFKNVTNGKEERIQGSFSWFNPVELIQGIVKHLHIGV